MNRSCLRNRLGTTQVPEDPAEHRHHDDGGQYGEADGEPVVHPHDLHCLDPASAVVVLVAVLLDLVAEHHRDAERDRQRAEPVRGPVARNILLRAQDPEHAEQKGAHSKQESHGLSLSSQGSP